MNSKHKFLILIGVLILILFAAVVLYLANAQQNTLAVEVQDMLDQSSCQAPCLYGQNLDKLEVEEIPRRIDDFASLKIVKSGAVDDQRYIEWEWTDETFDVLIQDDYKDLFSWDYFVEDRNYVKVNDSNRVIYMNIVFVTSLEELINIFGTPSGYFTSHPSRFHEYYLGIVFDDNIEGYFKIRTSCDEPSIEPDTVVLGYRYDRGWSNVETIPRLRSWEGFGSDIPTCAEEFVP